MPERRAEGNCLPKRRPFSVACLSWVVPLAMFLLLAGCPGVQVSPNSSAGGSASLSWTAPTTNSDGTAVTGLAGYRIYVGTDPANLSLRGGISGSQATTFEVLGLAPATYYFAVSAYNESGEESAKSNIGIKTIP
jgi:hypothetical protein